jgi:TolB-like protein
MGNAASPITHLLREMRRRRVFRTAALYIVGTWLVMQVADVVFPALDIPERSIRYVLIAALLGFLPAMVFGWFYDVGVHGIRRTGQTQPGEADATLSLGRNDYIILAALAGVAIAIIYDAVGNVVETPGRAYEEVRTGPPMVAVLPFVSASLGGESAFFATGVHDDLLTQLAQLQSLRVISRTSVLEFKDTIRNIREIGKTLGADAILEGGVQSAGNRIRINAQLIDAHTDEHLWAQTYDRELSTANIFDVQTEIARAITSAMRIALTEQDAAQLAVIPTDNMAAYRAYHHAMEIWENRGEIRDWQVPYREALQEAVTLDPTFTRAWAELVGNLTFANFFMEDDPELTVQAEQALERIRVLAPNSADHLIAQSYYTYYTLKDYDRAAKLITQAQGKAPSDLRLLELKSWIQRRQGDFEGRIETLRLGQRLDPRSSQWTASLVRDLASLHRYDEIAAELSSTPFDGFWLSFFGHMLELQETGDWDRWLENLYVLAVEYEGTVSPVMIWEWQIAARDYAAAEATLDQLRPRGEDWSPGLPYQKALRILTYYFQGRNDELPEHIADARAYLARGWDENGEPVHFDMYFERAFLAAVEGDTDEAVRSIRRWEPEAVEDLAGYILFKNQTCQILAMAGAAREAVRCIREGIAEPSNLIPFVEPFLPFYDLIRDEPEFVELLAEIDSIK